MKDDPVKVTVYLDKDVNKALNETVPWGSKSRLICEIARLITSALRRDGGIMLGAIISGQYKLVLDLDRKEDDRAET